ncbi:MAG: DUF6600 domain-containing protein [Georgfuchsia sp.]
MPIFHKLIRHSFALRHLVQTFCALTVLMAAAPQAVFAQQQNSQDMQVPPRIGMVSGTASFWRPGSEDWSPAQVNTALAAGDALYTADAATIEVQIGARAYVRMAQHTMLTLLGNEPDLQQFKMTSGIAAFDLRSLPVGRSVEIDTPSAAFNIDNAGYYRLEITDTTTHFVVRRGGEVTVTLPDGGSRLIAPSQEAVIEGDNVETYVAPAADTWDEWNYARTDNLIDAISDRYVSPEVYGTDDLDHYGNWRVTPDYGPVWVPDGMAQDWAPYSSGSWVWDPVYAWTWVDTAPWGWAPYHYGRWVNISGFWAWAPGPRHHHPVYAPALVAFFHGSGSSLQISIGGPAVGWVALGWGEPCLPWWGQPGFVGRPWWGGWAGPRVAHNDANYRYRNFNHRNAVIAMPEKSFGHGRVANARRVDAGHIRDLRPIAGQHPMRPKATSFAPTTRRSVKPAENVINRPAFGLHRPSQRGQLPQQAERLGKAQTQQRTTPDKVITVRPQQKGQKTPWARFGQSAGPERGEPQRAPDPPRVETWSSKKQPQMRQESRVTRSPGPEQARPMPQRQQQPARNVDTPQRQRQEQAPAQIINLPPQTPASRQREASRIPVKAQAGRPMPQREKATSNARSESSSPLPQREMRREQVSQSRGNRPQEAAAALPGQPANRLYQRHVPRNEKKR